MANERISWEEAEAICRQVRGTRGRDGSVRVATLARALGVSEAEVHAMRTQVRARRTFVDRSGILSAALSSVVVAAIGGWLLFGGGLRSIDLPKPEVGEVIVASGPVETQGEAAPTFNYQDEQAPSVVYERPVVIETLEPPLPPEPGQPLEPVEPVEPGEPAEARTVEVPLRVVCLEADRKVDDKTCPLTRQLLDSITTDLSNRTAVQ